MAEALRAQALLGRGHKVAQALRAQALWVRGCLGHFVAPGMICLTAQAHR